jgi:polar amino acid transport system substrate-binding protein
MRPDQVLLAVLFSVVLAIGSTYYVSGNFRQGTNRNAQETRLEQVKRTGVFRCGYIVWPPFFTKDSNTGKMGGPFYETVEEMGHQLKLKIEWAGEVGPGQMLADLALNRFDMICTPAAVSPAHAREGDFTNPVAYLPIHLYVRKGDARFDATYERANKPDITFATLDGSYASTAAHEGFPAAAKTTLPQLSHAADLFMAVATKKADLVVEDPFSFHNYAASNPDQLRPVTGKPLHVLAIGFPLPANEPALKAMLNTTLAYLHDSRFIDKTLKKYDDPVKFIRVAKPYAE